MKKIESLTKKQEAMMPIWRDKWIEIGLRTGATDWDTFEKNIRICYEKANIPFPNKIIRVQSPIVGAFASSISDNIINKKGDSGFAVEVAVRGAVGDAVGGAVRDAVGGAVGGAVEGAVGGAVRDAVEVAVGGAVGDAVRDAVRDAVEGAVEVAVRGAVRGAVRDAVEDAVRDAVEVAVGGAVTKKNIAWHYWLGGQMWVGYWYGSPSMTSFFFDVCKLKLSKDIMERADAYRKICESVNYMWLNKDFVMVCARPKHIDRNAQGRLHSDKRQAIEYPDGWGLYYINGVKFDKGLWEKVVSKKMPFNEIMAIADVDQRRQAMKYGNIDEFLSFVKAKTLDEYTKIDINGNPVNYKLVEIPRGELFNKNVHYCIYDCPSTRDKMMKGVPMSETVAEAMAWGMSDEAHIVSPDEWKLLVPLQHES